jgi:hypothetical protein
VDERNDTERIGDLEAWAFRAGRDLAEIKTQLKGKSTVAAVDALHQDVTGLRQEVRQGFADVKAEQAAQRRLLEAILERVGGGSSA